jgi:hypothetical protein
MYLSLYFFDGDPQALAAAHADMLANYFPPETLSVHALVTTETGVVMLDACPSREVHQAFAASPEFREALVAVGLGEPRIQGLGDVEWLRVAPAAVSA